MLLVMVKANFTLRFMSLNIWESLHVQVKISSLPKILLCDHRLVCNNIVSFEGFPAFANGTNDFRIKLQESLLIHRDGPVKQNIRVTPFDAILLRRIIFVASCHCIALQSP